MRAINEGFLRSINPANVARTTLCGLAEPSDFVSTLWIPALSTTARTAPPAMRPVPSGAGLSRTLPAPKRPTTRCGIVAPDNGTRIRFFLAASMPFLMADGTSLALPTPKPTMPWPSPTTTSALKLRFLPPFTTLVTRLMDTTVSFISIWEPSIFSRLRFMVATLELQACFASRVGDRFDASVIEEPVPVEHHLLDALFDQAFGDRLADGLGPRHIAAAGLLGQRALPRRLDGGRGRDGGASRVVDHLHVDVGHTPEHGQPRPLERAQHALADPALDPVSTVFLRLDTHRLPQCS